MAAFRLIPREEKFYSDFRLSADELQRGARLLEEMLAPEHPIWDKADEIKEVEHKCDFLTHEIIQRLNRTFVTPLDREDIHALARSLDDVMDAIDASATSSGCTGSTTCGSARANSRRSSPPRPTRSAWRSRALEKKQGRHRRTPSRSTGSRTKPTAPPAGGQPPVRRRARSAAGAIDMSSLVRLVLLNKYKFEYSEDVPLIGMITD